MFSVIVTIHAQQQQQIAIEPRTQARLVDGLTTNKNKKICAESARKNHMKSDAAQKVNESESGGILSLSGRWASVREPVQSFS